MIVDDDPVVLDAMQRLLTMWGYSTLPISSFEEARVSLGVQSPDALIVDIRLGEYNGLQLVHLAKRSNPSLTIVVVSGYDDPVLRHEARQAGAAYLLKPTELPLLRDHLPPAETA
jgi:DNA-binding response OmpR family regulator